MLHSKKQSEALSFIRTLSTANERFISATNSNFDSARLDTLIILGKLENAHSMHTRSEQEREDRDQKICLQLSQLASNLRGLTETRARSARESRILESLYHDRMEARQKKIIDTHAQTFEWIFDPRHPSSALASNHSFLEWLINGSGIFWITGKAGSGKSTLMKFLSHHKSATQALQRWTDDKDLITADFYFWHAGTELQKSQEGLLRSLLHDVLSQCPELMRQVLPKLWEQSKFDHIKSHLWNRAELLSAFAELSLQTKFTKRFCFFIDGLDEYDGDHAEIVELVQSLVQSDDIKICLSSRPWNVFTRAFGWGSHPTFRLEELTWRDIQSYVQDTLNSNKLFRQLMAGKDSARCENLQVEIVSRAQGVFLWVFLVVRSLVQGLTNADRITDLERRLRSLPVDLETYFRHMLDTIEDVYKQQTVQTFHIALQAAEPLNLMTYVMLDEIEENPDYAIELPAQQMTRGDIESRCQDMKLRINARCKDLLQVTRKKSPQWKLDDYLNYSMFSHESSDGGPSPQPLFQYEVDFLHRSVKDFFRVNDIQTFVASRLPKTLNSSDLLCHAFLAQIKVTTIESQPMDRISKESDLIDDLMHYAHEAEVQTAHPNIVLLDELSNTLKLRYNYLHFPAPDHFPRGLMEETSIYGSVTKICQSFLSFAVQRDLRLYVACKLDKPLHHVVPDWENDMMFFCALRPSVPSKYGLQSPNRAMLRLLVDKGVEMNKPLVAGDVGPASIWDQVIAQIEPQWWYMDVENKVQQLEIINALLECDAESNRSTEEFRHKWVDVLLRPHGNWCSHNIDFEAALTKAIVAFCERGIDPSGCYTGWGDGEETLWLLLIRSICPKGQNPPQLSLKTKGYVMMILKKFVGLGAQLNDLVSGGNTAGVVTPMDISIISSRQQSTVAESLARIFSPAEMEELESVQRRVKAESLKRKTSRAQRRKDKKKRKERRKGRNVELIA